jgi:hypothetical protein
MVKFLDDAKTKATTENVDAVKAMTINISIKDLETGKTKEYEGEKVMNVKFKERKKKLYIRFKCESGLILSIPKDKMPKFIKIEVENQKVW